MYDKTLSKSHPIIIWMRESLIIPHKTEVGQSGPPISTATGIIIRNN